MLKVIEAIRLATVAHDGQRRKHTSLPYIIHPLRVLHSVVQWLDLESMKDSILNVGPMRQDVCCICVLHDVIEDTKVTAKGLEDQFGHNVADGVVWLTNPSKGSTASREDRKKMDREHLMKAPDYIKAIKLADREDNLIDFGVAGPPQFLLERYIPESRLLVESIANDNIRYWVDRVLAAANTLEIESKKELESDRKSQS